MAVDRRMYRWQRMTPQQRREALAVRRQRGVPWHGPPHFETAAGLYLITTACYQHRPIIGSSVERLAEFEAELLSVATAHSQQLIAWTVLPNHYHLLVRVTEFPILMRALGRLHGRISHRWNGEEGARGRTVWHRSAETGMTSERHFWAALNYVLHNAVRHGYAERWQDWPYSSAAEYLAEVGREDAERRWREFPILDFGKEWDPPEL